MAARAHNQKSLCRALGQRENEFTPFVVQSAYKAEQHTVSKLGSTMKHSEDKLFNGCEVQLL